MSELTQAAKAEIAAAIAIVREDRFEKHAREVLGKHTPPTPTPPPTPAPDPVFDPPKDPTATPPPPKPADPAPTDEPKGRRSAYWNEIFPE